MKEGDETPALLIFRTDRASALGYRTYYVVSEEKAGERPASDLSAGGKS